MNIFFHHVGEKGAKEDFPKTVFSSKGISIINESPKAIKDSNREVVPLITKIFPSGEFNCWGIPSGAEKVFKKINLDDVFLLVESVHWPTGIIPAMGEVKFIFYEPQPELSRLLWGDEHFPFIFLFKTEKINLSWFQFMKDISYSENFDPRGHVYRVSDGRFSTFGGPRSYVNHIRTTYENVSSDLSLTIDDIRNEVRENTPDYITGIKKEYDSIYYSTLSAEPRLQTDDNPTNIIEIRERKEAFRIGVKKLYHNRCIICGTALKAPNGTYEVEAAHIYPKSLNGSDDLRNGISLCRFHHWAFDAGWISISNELTILVRIDIPMNDEYSRIWSYRDHKILLPDQENLYPHRIFIEAHRKLHGF